MTRCITQFVAWAVSCDFKAAVCVTVHTLSAYSWILCQPPFFRQNPSLNHPSITGSITPNRLVLSSEWFSDSFFWEKRIREGIFNKWIGGWIGYKWIGEWIGYKRIGEGTVTSLPSYLAGDTLTEFTCLKTTATPRMNATVILSLNSPAKKRQLPPRMNATVILSLNSPGIKRQLPPRMNATVMLSLGSSGKPFVSVYSKKRASPNAVSFCGDCFTTPSAHVLIGPAPKEIRLNADMTFNN